MVEPLTDVLVEKALAHKGGVQGLKGKASQIKRKAPESKCKKEATEVLCLLVGLGCAEVPLPPSLPPSLTILVVAPA
jgi:hypothetical protein